MKALIIIATLLLSSAVYSQEYDFSDYEKSLNKKIFEAINVQRAERGLQQVRYNFSMQLTLNEISEQMKVQKCHCFGDNYVTEALVQGPSVDWLIEFLKTKWKDNPVRSKKIEAITIGISEDEEAIYFAIRGYYAPITSSYVSQ